jgi:hypothetical protein
MTDAQRESEIMLHLSKSNGQVRRQWTGYLDPRLVAITLGIVASGLGRAVATKTISWTVLVLPAAAVPFVAYYLLRRANVTLYLRSDRIGITNSLGIRKEVAITSLAALVICSVSLPQRQQPLPLLIGVSKSGRCLLRFSGADRLGLSGIRHIAAVAGLELRGSWSDTSALSQIDARYPGTAPPLSGIFVWVLAHRRLVSGLTIVATILVFVGLIALTTTGR